MLCLPPGNLPKPGIESRSPTLQADSLLTEPPGRPKNTAWVAYPFFRGFSRLRNWTGVSWIAGKPYIWVAYQNKLLDYSQNFSSDPLRFSDGVCVLSHAQLFATLWTGAHQAPLSIEFSRQENWFGLPFPLPVDLPDLGIKPVSPALAGIVYHWATWEALRFSRAIVNIIYRIYILLLAKNIILSHISFCFIDKIIVVE